MTDPQSVHEVRNIITERPPYRGRLMDYMRRNRDDQRWWGDPEADETARRKLRHRYYNDPTSFMAQWGYGPDKQWRFEARIAIYAADVADQIEKHAVWGSEQLSVHRLQLNPLTEVMEIYADAETLARLRDRAAELGTVDEASTEYLGRIETALLQRVTVMLQYRRTLDAPAAPAIPPADPGPAPSDAVDLVAADDLASSIARAYGRAYRDEQATDRLRALERDITGDADVR